MVNIVGKLIIFQHKKAFEKQKKTIDSKMEFINEIELNQYNM